MISNDNKKAFKRLLQSSQTGDPVQASRALADLGQQGVKEVFHNTLKSNNDPLFISASLGHCEVVESILKSFILHCNNNTVEIRDDFNSTSPSDSTSPNPHQNRSSMNHNNLRREDSFFAPISTTCECNDNDFLRSEDDGTSFLTIAIRNGHSSVVRVLVKIVKQLLHVVHSSPQIEKKSLLEKDEGALFGSKNNNGNTSGVFNSPKSPEASTMKKTASSSIFDESFSQQNNNNNNFGIVIMLRTLTNLLNAEDSEGNTPLSLAISENHLSIVKMLVVELNSFKILGDNNNDGSVLPVVDPNGFENNIKNENLHSATRSGRFNINDRTALVEISNSNSNNKTPVPAGRMSSIASPALLRTAATNRTITGGNETKRYASYLWQACKSGDVEVVKILLSSPVSCDVLLPSIYGTTPLMIACQYGKSEIVKLLLNSSNESCIITESLLNAEETAPSKKTCVNFAAENGHVEVIQILLSAKREQIANQNNNNNNKNDNVILLKDFINHRDQSTGDTPLLAATRNGHTQLVQLLANLFHDSEESTDILLAQNSASGQTALSIAASRGFDEIVDVLVTLYPELVFIGDYDDGFLPIHYAASKNQFEIIENLVAMTENISKNKKNSNNNNNNHNNLNVLVSRASESDDTPLSVACRVGATQTVQVILDLAKNSRNSEELLDELILSNDVGQDGVCCCFIACEKGFVDIFCMLLSACPSFDPFSISTCRQSDQCSCLAVAAQNGREEIVQILLMRGRASLISSRSKSNEHRDDDDDDSEDDEEEENNNNENHHEHLQSLLDLPSLEGVTPVYRACDSGHVGTVSLLLNGGCDGDLATQNGWRPLTIAVYKGHFDCVAELLSRNDISNNGSNEDQENIPWVNVNATLSSSASTALHLACSSKSIPKQFSRRYIRGQLLQQFNHEILNDGDDDEESSDDGDVGEENIFNDSNNSLNNPATRILIKRLGTPREKIIRLLLRHGAGINAQTFPTGVFPLFFCAQENHLDCVKALVECGADVALQTQKGFTALDVARACNHEAIARYLELFEDEFSKNMISNDNFNFNNNNNSSTNNSSTVEMLTTLLENILLEREDVAKEYLDEKQIEFEASSVSSWIRWFVESGKRRNELQERESGGDHHVDADQRQLLQEDRKEEVQKEVIESDDDVDDEL